MTDKLDTKGLAGMELIFSVLRKHEESLDKVTGKLEDVVDAISMVRDKNVGPKVDSENLVVDSVPSWKEFRERATSADQILYQTGMGFSLRAIYQNGQVLKYYEPFLKPGLALFQISKSTIHSDDTEEVLKLECGLEYSVTRTQSLTDDEEFTERLSVALNLKKMKEWLCLQLGVDESRIAPGVVVI